MGLNQTKTTVAKFGTRQQLAELDQNILMIDDNLQIDISDNVRSLGLTYDANMNFNAHFQQTADCVNNISYCLRSVRSINSVIIVTKYHICFRSLISFMSLDIVV